MSICNQFRLRTPAHVTHRARDRLMSLVIFPTGAPLQPSLFLAPAVWEIMGTKHIGSRLWPFRVTWRHRSLTVRLTIVHFLLVVLWNQASISNGFRDIFFLPQTLCSHRHMLKHHCVCAISRDIYPHVKFKYIFQFLTPTLPICHYHYYWALMKNNGCSLSWPLMLKAKSSEHFCLIFMAFRWPGDQGVWKVTILLQKAHPCVSHCAWRSVGRSDIQGRVGKSQKVTRGSHRIVSPLTQGLNYRSTCDRMHFLTESI